MNNYTHAAQLTAQSFTRIRSHTNTGFRPTLLCVAIALALTSPAFADTVSCEHGADNCTATGTPPAQPDIKPSITMAGNTLIDILTTDLNTAGNATNSIVGNTVTLDYTATSPAQPAIKGVMGAATDVTGAEVKDNKVVIKNGSVGASIGGFSLRGNATDNSVTISGGSVTGKVVGGHSPNGNNTGNSVTIGGGTVGGNVLGGHSPNGNNTGNSVTIGGGTVGGDVTSGSSYVGNVTGNSVTISGGTLNSEEVTSGYSFIGNVTGNSVTISGGTLNVDDVLGGDSSNGNATGNSVTISGSARVDNVYGAKTKHGDSIGNKVIVSGGEVSGNVRGGYSKNGNATDNSVTISGGTISDRVYGGKGKYGVVKDNKVNISGGETKGNIYGGYTESNGNATGNIVTISGTSRVGRVYGAKTKKGDSIGNKVIVSGGDVGSLNTTDMDLYGGFSKRGNAIDNEVIISGGTIYNEIRGGYTRKDDAPQGNATGNSVIISGGVSKKNISGGYTSKGNAEGNSVTISGGTIEKDIFGGQSYNGDVTGNTVTIAAGSAITFAANTVLHGGFDKDTATPNDVFTGNTLNIHRKGVKVNDIKNFENYRFYLDSTVSNGDSMLELTSAGVTDISGSKYGVGVASGNALNVGDEIILINKQSGDELKLSSANPTNTITGMSGISTMYQFDLKGRSTDADTDNEQLVATVSAPPVVTPPAPNPSTPPSYTPPAPEPDPVVTTPEPVAGVLNPQTKSLLEARLANASLVERGVDLAAAEGLHTLSDSVAQDNSAVRFFGAMSYSDHKTETGSYVDLQGGELVIGAGAGIDNSVGSLEAGAYIELGAGSYETFNEFNDSLVNDVYATGNTNYYGIGLMGKQTFANNVDVGAGISAGRTQANYNSSDMKGTSNTEFETDSAYISAFAELGYTTSINSSMKVRPYANVKAVRIDSDSQEIVGDTYTFDEVNSTRTTLGARVNQALTSNISAYADIAWEHQFDGSASGSVVGFDIDSPTLEGDTGVFAVGIDVTPTSNKNLTFSFGATGSAGKRKGASVNANLNYKF